VILLTCAASAAAEWQFTPLVGFTFGGSTSISDPESGAAQRHWHFGGTVGLIGPGPLGVEALFVYIPGFFNGPDRPGELPTVASSRSYALMGNVILTVPSRNRYGLRPFLSGGAGLLYASYEDLLEVFSPSEKLTGYNIGGGAVGFLSDRTGVRFELRHYGTLIPREAPGVAFGTVRLRYWSASAGVVIRY
jgi:hypothetical protein